MTLEQRISFFAARVAQEIKAIFQSKGAVNGIAPLDSAQKVPAVNMLNAWNRLVQNLSALPIDWRLGLIVKFTMPAATVTASVGSFNFPITGETHIIILLNTTGASRNFVLPNVATHRSNVTTIAVGNNQRRKCIAHFDGAIYDWTIENAKAI